MKRFRSRRADGRGHWPRGRRYHPNGPVGGFASVEEMCRVVLCAATERQMGAELARRLGVPQKTIWRWKVNEDVPHPRHAKRLAAWYLRHFA